MYNHKMSEKTKTFEFDKLYGVLNTAQRKAVDAIEGPVLVIAGPGTGKTTILTLRIANILRKTDTSPENILALTFTESGVYAMRRKLLEIIGPSAYKVRIHTFHGFAESIIQEYPDYFPRIIGSTIITDAEQIKIIEKIIQSRSIKILRPYGDPSYYVKSVLNEIHLLKRENVSPEALRRSIDSDSFETLNQKIPHLANREAPPLKRGPITTSPGLPATPLPRGTSAAESPFLKGVPDRVGDLSATEKEKLQKSKEKNLELAFVYSQYEAELAKQKYYDFDDMLLELIRAMEENDTFKLMLQETFQYILADEHQDANAAQNKIIELLADFHDSPNLFIVGDDKQAIYRFQGASLENFLYFSKKYKNAEVIELTHNYRSHQGILDASHSVIAHNPSIPGHERRKLLSLQIGTKPIFIDEFPTSNDELEYLAILLERLVKKSEKSQDIAILYRENKEARAISDALRAHGIAHRIESDHDILDDVDSAKIVMLCRAINDPSNSEMLGQVLLFPEMKCDPAEVAEVCALANRERKPLHVIIRAQGLNNIKGAYMRIVEWSREAQTLPFPDFLQKLIEETGLVASIVAAPNSLERLVSLEVLFNKIVKAAQSKKTFYLKDFIEYIDIVSTHGIMTKRTYAEHIGGVRLMTAHRAKGLEFNHVFITHAVDGIWGNRSKRNLFTIPIIEHARDTGRIEDERRLFYVAMTRARESVNVSYARSNGEKETIPAQFLAEIEPGLVSFEKPTLNEMADFFKRKMTTPHAKPAISILEPTFVRSKFLSQPFSVTHLNNYLKCPWEYFFVNLIRIPQAPTKHQMYGTAIHAALRSFFEAYKVERDMSKKKLLEIFKHNLEMQALSVDDRKESLEKGNKALSGYFETYDATWPRELVTEYAVKGVQIELRDGSKLELTGKLDKIELLNQKDVVVVDYKTSKPKSRNDIEGKTKTADGNYKRQLVFYKLLLDGTTSDHKHAKKFNMKSGVIDFIEPNERGIYKKEAFEVTPKEVQELAKVIAEAAEAIFSLAFIEETCGDKDCKYCRLGKILKATAYP